MAAVAARIVVGGTFMASLGALTYCMQSRANQVEKEQRGSLLRRMGETARACINSRQIGDKIVAKQHVSLVSALSSKHYAHTCSQAKSEQDKLAASYFAGYLFETTSKVYGRQPFVFRYTENLSIALPKIHGSSYEGFIFSGPSSKIHDPVAREQILNGQYTRCSTQIPCQDALSQSYKRMDVVIAGTTDFRKCFSFETDFMNDVVMSAANKTIDPSHPLSDTPVYEVSEDDLKQVGDLAEFPKITKTAIGLGNYTICNFFSIQKTRLTGGTYKQVGAVMVGVKHPKICEGASFRQIQQLLDSSKQQESDK